jgi:myosin-crossreactive antigen
MSVIINLSTPFPAATRATPASGKVRQNHDRGGITSMAAAAFPIGDVGVPGKNIHILETIDVAGGTGSA